MKNLTKSVLLLAMTICFISCENETFDQPVENALEETITPDLVTFTPITGNIGESFNRVDGKYKLLENLDEAAFTKARFLYIDTDQLATQPYSYDDLLVWSTNSKIGLIFESATSNHLNTHEFYTTTVGGADLDYIVEGLIVEQSATEYKSTFTVVNSENGINADDTVHVLFEELYESKFPTILDREPAVAEFYDNDNPVITEELTKGYVTYVSVTYTNISQSKAEAKAKALANARAGNNSSFSGFSNYTKHLNSTLVFQSNSQKEYLKTGNKHDALGKCSGQQTASYGQSMSYSKSWSTSFTASVNVGKTFTFGGSYSFGGSTTSGTMNTSSISMRKRYAKGGISTYKKWCKGYVLGNIKFRATSHKQIRGQVQVNVTLKFTGNGNKWTGWRQKTEPAFTWEQWGYTLPNC
ncbi:hypothetical protein GCM10022393_17110 [Aquimarina addita]|uniref:DUF1735 domain-containing protein n=1 Tax=Aquimarina addita TaxID=870485 RepID=A0ABP7XI14_9FLAO